MPMVCKPPANALLRQLVLIGFLKKSVNVPEQKLRLEFNFPSYFRSVNRNRRVQSGFMPWYTHPEHRTQKTAYSLVNNLTAHFIVLDRENKAVNNGECVKRPNSAGHPDLRCSEGGAFLLQFQRKICPATSAADLQRAGNH